MKTKKMATYLLGAAAAAVVLNALKPGLLLSNVLLLYQRLQDGPEAPLPDELPAGRIPKVVGVN